MSQDMQSADSVPHTDGPSGSSVHQEMPGSATISHNMEHLGQGHEESDNRQYTTGDIEMMFNDGLFGKCAESDNSGQVETNEMDTAGQQHSAVEPESHGDNIAPVVSEDNCPTLRMDEGDAQLTRLDEVAKNPHGNAATKLDPEGEGETDFRDVNTDYSMGEAGHEGEIPSSTFQHMSELPQEVSQDAIMKDESGDQGNKFTSLGEGGSGTEVHTHQDEREVTIPTNQSVIWSEGPAATKTSFEKESQYAVFQKNHEDSQPEQKYGGRMPQGTVDQQLGPRGREIDQLSTSTRPVDFWKHREITQSGYEGNKMSMAGKDTVVQHTLPSNAPMSGVWPTYEMNDVQYQTFGRPIDFGNTSTSSHPSMQNNTPLPTSNAFASFQPPTQGSSQQQVLNSYNQSPVDALFARQQQLRAQVEEKRRQLENARRLHEQTQRQAQQISSLSFAPNQASGPASFLMGPLSYQRAPQGGYPQVPLGNNNAGNWPQMQSESWQSQMGLSEGPASYPTQGQEVNRPTPGPSTAPEHSKTQQQDLKQEPDDDEPLITRTQHHPSLTSQTSTTHQPSTSQPSVPPSTTPAPSTSIDWRLPQYDVHLDPTPADASQPTAKISLPGLVREELLLSPDHADQEIHLLLNVFLPGQRALATPDPHPAVAILNFHTIALMVIEAYVQYEIGDELGRRNPYYAPLSENTGEQEYERIRDARSADVDEIFFAVVDRWRAGRESGKQSLSLIRGVQEFCEVALDVVYYVKENGLLGGVEQQQQEEEEEEEQEEVKTKGKGKGKAVAKEEGVAVLKAKPKAKRAAAADKTETGARKKGKPAVKKEEPKKRVRKPAAGITVVKR